MNDILVKLQKMFEPKATIGVDMGRRNIKTLSLKKQGDKVLLENLFMLDLAESNESFPEVANAPEKLKAAIEVHGLRDNKVSVSMNDDSIDSFLINIPEMPESEIYSVVENALEARIPYPVEDASYDFTILERSPQDKDNLMTVKVFFALKKNVDTLLDQVEQARLKPVSLDINSLAIATMLEFNGYTEKGHNFILVDLGESQTTTSLIMDHDVVFLRSVPFAYGSINQSLREYLDFNYAEAEKIKQRLNAMGAEEANVEEQIHINSLEDAQETVDYVVAQHDAQKIADQNYIHILDSVQETIDYYLAQSNEAPITGIYLTGGGANQEVKEVFENHYGVEATIVNPFRRVELYNGGQDTQNIDQYSPFMATAMGLALRGIKW
ncbi:MAG: type IV pilus assembly protein PilM [Bdellovibrionales bacterium]